MDPVDQLLRQQQDLATRAQLRAAGLTRRGLERALRDGRLTRLQHGLYVAGRPPARASHLLSGGRPDPGYVALVRAALLQLGPGAAASGRTAAVLLGWDLAVEPAHVEVAVPLSRSRTQLRGVLTTRRSVPVLDVQPVPGAPLTVVAPVVTALDCAGALPLDQAVAAVDSALRAGTVTRDELQVAALRHLRNRQVLSVLRLCDAACGSVLESLLRVLLAQAGLPLPRTQHVVRTSDGRFLGRVDLCWPDRRLVVEADGRRWHDPEDARERDRKRENGLAAHGWRVLRVTWSDVVHSPDSVVALVRAALAA